MLDGYIARKKHLESEIGSKIDSIADLIFLIIVTYKIINYLPYLKTTIIWIVLISIIKIITFIISYLKYKKIVFLHNYPNKMIGFILFIVPFLLLITKSKIFINTICIISLLTALYENYYLIERYKNEY